MYKEECWACGCEECVCVKRTSKREWVGYTKEDRERIVPMLVQSLINHDEKTMVGLLNAILIDIEQQLREKNK